MADWVLVIDDDTTNLKMASRILTENGMRVSVLKSGEAALEFLKSNRPDIILLDIHMQGIDGFETMEAIQAEPATADIPVIFLTADDNSDTEIRALQQGVMDFIRKPFVAEVLMSRIRHTIQLIRLQNNLSQEVERQTAQVVLEQERVEKLFLQVVDSLAGAVDAKDSYTNGHSSRVAHYSKLIAEKYGMSEEEQDNIYIIALLHDVGKIGVPDGIITKPSRLTDEEFDIIKTHTTKGAAILENIAEFPMLSIGAKCHHERYDGRGYPDGISGGEIPLEARIIAVADSYDAMTSNRSYRDALPQEVVRSEVEKGCSTQFDPVFADIMLQIIDEDVDYTLREMKAEA